jgi:Tol biopolymer transport system component
MRQSSVTRWVMCFVLLMVASWIAPAMAGDAILFVSTLEGSAKFKFNIFTMDADGSKQTNLTKSEDSELDPVYSPDSKHIAFIVLKDAANGPQSSIFVMNADGKGRKALTDKPELVTSPAWSHDGKRLAFSTLEMGGGGPPKSSLFVMDADGKDRKELGEGLFPQWSADDNQIAYSLMGEKGKPRQYIMDGEGKKSENLIEGTAMMAVWSPDGKQIAYLADPGDDQPDLFVMNADKTNKRQLTKTPDFEFGVQWSSDGKHLFFTRMPKGAPRAPEAPGSGIYSIGVDGKDEKQLTKGSGMKFLGGGSMMFMVAGRAESRPVRVEKVEDK